MTPILTLDEAKAFLRVDGPDDDAVIETLIGAATETVMDHADGLLEGDEVPDSVRTGALLLVAHWFTNREAVVVGLHPAKTPLASEWLASRYRKWGV
jgi:Phage QLRG family, putative DNA packaging.